MNHPRIGVRCDANTETGVGHVVRCMALAEELVSDGATVAFFGDIRDAGWIEKQLDSLGVLIFPGPSTPDSMIEATRRHQLDAWVLDSYTLNPDCAKKLREHDTVVLAIIDDDPRGQLADIYLDQNFGSPTHRDDISDNATLLAGLDYVLLRDGVLDLRPTRARTSQTPTAPLRVLAFFGGTDFRGAAPIIAELLVATGIPMDIIMVAASKDRRTELEQIYPADGQTLAVISPTLELPRLIAHSDLVICAAGTSTWEVMCLGAAAALVCVADNQRFSYARVIDAGLTAGLGHVDNLRSSPTATQQLVNLLTNRDMLDKLRATAWETVDGNGKKRVAQQLITAIRKRRPT